jgi:hypothetical protein
MDILGQLSKPTSDDVTMIQKKLLAEVMTIIRRSSYDDYTRWQS